MPQSADRAIHLDISDHHSKRLNQKGWILFASSDLECFVGIKYLKVSS